MEKSTTGHITAKTRKYELCIDWLVEGFKALIVTVGLFSYCKLASYVFQVYRDHPWRLQSDPNYRSLHLNMEIQLRAGSDDTLGGAVHVYEETPLTDKNTG